MKAALLLLLLTPLTADAALKDCGWNSDRTMYDCEGAYTGGAAGASAPLLGDSLEGNPAALPSEDTPFGLEGGYAVAHRRKPKVSVSTARGFDGIGFGLGSWSEGSFAAPLFAPHFLASASAADYLNYENGPPSSSLGLRLGGVAVMPKALLPGPLRLSVGGSLGFGKVQGDASPQAGVMLRLYLLGLGYSHSYERISRSLPRVTVVTYSAGLRLESFYLGYSYYELRSIVHRSFANEAGVRWNGPAWTLFAMLKWWRDQNGNPDRWPRAGLLRRIGSRLGFGYEFGQYRDSHGLVMQLFL